MTALRAALDRLASQFSSDVAPDEPDPWTRVGIGLAGFSVYALLLTLQFVPPPTELGLPLLFATAVTAAAGLVLLARADRPPLELGLRGGALVAVVLLVVLFAMGPGGFGTSETVLFTWQPVSLLGFLSLGLVSLLPVLFAAGVAFLLWHYAGRFARTGLVVLAAAGLGLSAVVSRSMVGVDSPWAVVLTLLHLGLGSLASAMILLRDRVDPRALLVAVRRAGA